MISAQLIEKRKRLGQVLEPGLRDLRERLAKTYRYQTLKERMIELAFHGGTGHALKSQHTVGLLYLFFFSHSKSILTLFWYAATSQKSLRASRWTRPSVRCAASMCSN